MSGPKKKRAPASKTPNSQEKKCSTCKLPGGQTVDGVPCGFPDGGAGRLAAECRRCKADAQRARYDARQGRINSDYASLKVDEDFDDEDEVKGGDDGDYDTSVANDGTKDKKAAEEKRQEYSRRMGEFADSLKTTGGDPDQMDAALGTYIGRLAEQERRFGNRRIARSVSLAAAHEALHLRQVKALVAEYMTGKVAPTGYATLKPVDFRPKRTNVLGLSDLHLGADIKALDNPKPFTAIEEARRLEFIVRQALDFKPQYREDSELLIIINGDTIEGLLLHDLRDGAPLAEQKLIFWKHFQAIMGLAAQQYKKVRVVCQPGNHGRDVVRHPGRATSRKWDGHEWEMFWALKAMCSTLLNVEWDLPFQAVSKVNLYGSWGLVTHADTEVKFGDPDTKAEQNARILDRINSTREYGVEFDWCFTGHYHKPRYIPGRVRHIWNGALIPANGHARGAGYIREVQGQWLWEATEGYPVGDARFIEVNESTDRDERLGILIPPFRIGEGRQ